MNDNCGDCLEMILLVGDPYHLATPKPWKNQSITAIKKNSLPYVKCVLHLSRVHGSWADLWPFYGLYCKRFSPSLKLFLLKSLHFRISSSGYLWSKLCKQLGELKLCMSCAWNLNVSRIYLTYCMEYVWKSSFRIGIFQRATQQVRMLWPTLYRTGAAVVSTITSRYY